MKINPIEIAKQNGAKLHKSESLKGWVVLDQKDNDLWYKSFKTERQSAVAFIHEKRLSKLLYNVRKTA